VVFPGIGKIKFQATLNIFTFIIAPQCAAKSFNKNFSGFWGGIRSFSLKNFNQSFFDNVGIV